MLFRTYVVLHYYFLILLCFSPAVRPGLCGKANDALGHVIASNVIFRHGQRTIIEPYPTDPYKNSSFWPEGFGQLTNEGKMQEFVLGQWLRDRYKNLLSSVYSLDDINIQSTDVDRTLMSAESVLAGLYPPTASQRWNSKIYWQPIPVHTMPELMDEILAMKKPCHRYSEEFAKVMLSPPITDKLSKYSNLLKYASQHTGEKMDSFPQLQNLYSTLFIENLNNYKLPNWTKEVFPNPLSSASAFTFSLRTFTENLARLKTGPLLKVMLENFRMHLDARENGRKKPKKVWLFSAHDDTVASIMNTLKVFKLHNPQFTACVLIELREKDNEYFVTITYRTLSGVSILTVPGCAELCPYHRFIEIFQPLIPSNWEHECDSDRMFELSENVLSRSLVLPLMLTTLILALLLLTTMLLFWKNQRQSRFYKKLKTDSI